MLKSTVESDKFKVIRKVQDDIKNQQSTQTYVTAKSSHVLCKGAILEKKVGSTVLMSIMSDSESNSSNKVIADYVDYVRKLPEKVDLLAALDAVKFYDYTLFKVGGY